MDRDDLMSFLCIYDKISPNIKTICDFHIMEGHLRGIDLI